MTLTLRGDLRCSPICETGGNNLHPPLSTYGLARFGELSLLKT